MHLLTASLLYHGADYLCGDCGKKDEFYIIVDYYWHRISMYCIVSLYSYIYIYIYIYISTYAYICIFVCGFHMDFPYLIEMKYETLVHIYLNISRTVFRPMLLIFYYFHVTKLTRHVFLSKLPLKVSKLIRVNLPVFYVVHTYTLCSSTFFPLRFL